jgi:ABC-2 type transport system permease protein
MKTLIKKLFVKKLKTINLIHLINGVLIVIYAATFPMLIDQQKTLDAFIQSMPKEFLSAFSVDSISMSSFEGYIATKHFMPMWIIILLIVAIPAGTFISKSLDNNTAELLFAQPISRIKSGFSIFISALLQTLYFTMISIAIIIPISWIFNIPVHYINYLYLTIEAIGFTFFITALTFALDAIFNDGGKVTGLMILFTIGSYVIYLMAKIITELDFIKYFTPFNYFDPSTSLGQGNINLVGFAGFILIGAVLLLFSIWRFNKKDLIK